MERNLRLYPLYQACWNLLFWLPVFFLYFSSRISPAQVLQLEAIYYLAVVLLEVPSGYFSDRIGRRVTLLIATLAWIAAGITFTLATGFALFAVAQLMLAVGMAFNSGTDSSLLFDSLAALGREDEIAEHEARGQARGFQAAALSAVVGGLVAGFDLRAPYALSALAALATAAIVWRFREPPIDETSQRLAPLQQATACVRLLRDPMLAWIFLFAVSMTVFNHVPYEFFQPWLDLLLAKWSGAYDLTPGVSGLLVAAVAIVASWATHGAAPLVKRLGVKGSLLLAMALQGLIMLAMAQWLHPAVLLALVARSTPRALSGPIMSAAIHPRVPTQVRASFLSMQSLAGRLSFSVCLTAASLLIGRPQVLSMALLSRILLAFAAGLAVIWILLAVLRLKSERVSV